MSDNLVITGMMGTGKTAAARLIAAQTGRQLVDLDARIEAAAGTSIAEIFARGGESGFRERERAAVAALGAEAGASHASGTSGSSVATGTPGTPGASGTSGTTGTCGTSGTTGTSGTSSASATSGVVVATGGWTMADPASRATLEGLGPVVCLRATPEALAERLADAPTARPVLGGASEPSAEHIRQLLEERQTTYDSIPLQVDTTARTTDAVATEVLALVESAGAIAATAIPVASPRGGYGVLIGSGLLETLGPILRAHALGRRVAIVTDDNVNAIYGARVMHALENAGATTSRVEIPAGEASKSLATVSDLYSAFVASRLDRNSTVVALGGGVVGDAAGFAAASYLRGVSLVQVPTTLLAMVDSSIGGKTGVNLPAGKNLVGAFKHPDLVITDPSVLRTLPPEELVGGLAEVVKAAVIGDPDLLDRLEHGGAPARDDAAAWADIVGRAAAVKALIVSQDPEESGRRAVLNLGHTFAHALEHATEHRVAHGPAVSVGLVAAARLAARVGRARPELAQRTERILLGLGLPVRYAGPDPSDLIDSMQTDKKRADGRLRFVLPADFGDVTLAGDVPEADVAAVLEELREADDGHRAVDGGAPPQ